MPKNRADSGDTGGFRPPATVRLSADGFATVLGDLEALVMKVLWRTGRPLPAREVHARVTREHDVTIHTVITVLNKLVTKGLLLREKTDELLHFRAAISEEDFRRRVSQQVVRGILSLGPDAVTASFVDVLAESDPDQLEKLAQLVRRRLEEQRGS